MPVFGAASQEPNRFKKLHISPLTAVESLAAWPQQPSSEEHTGSSSASLGSNLGLATYNLISPTLVF